MFISLVWESPVGNLMNFEGRFMWDSMEDAFIPGQPW